MTKTMSIRIPQDELERLDREAARLGKTRNELVRLALTQLIVGPVVAIAPRPVHSPSAMHQSSAEAKQGVKPVEGGKKGGAKS